MPLRNLAQLKTGLHLSCGALGVLGIGVPIRTVHRIAVEGPTENRRVRPPRRLFRVLRAQPPGGNGHHVIVQLRAQTDWIYVVMVLPASRLMSVAQVERFQLPEGGVPRPDAVSHASRAASGLSPSRRRSQHCDCKYPVHAYSDARERFPGACKSNVYFFRRSARLIDSKSARIMR